MIVSVAHLKYQCGRVILPHLTNNSTQAYVAICNKTSMTITNHNDISMVYQLQMDNLMLKQNLPKSIMLNLHML